MPRQITTLKEAVELIYLGPTLGRRSKSSAKMTSVRVVNIKDIRDEGISPINELQSADITQNQLDQFRLKAGDIVLTARSVLKASIVQPQHSGAIVGANLIMIRPGKILAGPLLLAFLNHPATRLKLEIQSTATTVKSINIDAVRKLRLVIPTAAKQEKLATLVRLSDEQFLAATRAAEIRREIGQRILIEALAE